MREQIFRPNEASKILLRRLPCILFPREETAASSRYAELQTQNKKQMKVHELIKLLQTFPPDHFVLVCGYEGGYDDAGKPYATRRKKGWDEWYMGKWDTYSSERPNTVVIPRHEKPLSKKLYNRNPDYKPKR